MLSTGCAGAPSVKAMMWQRYIWLPNFIDYSTVWPDYVAVRSHGTKWPLSHRSVKSNL